MNIEEVKSIAKDLNVFNQLQEVLKVINPEKEKALFFPDLASDLKDLTSEIKKGYIVVLVTDAKLFKLAFDCLPKTYRIQNQQRVFKSGDTYMYNESFLNNLVKDNNLDLNIFGKAKVFNLAVLSQGKPKVEAEKPKVEVKKKIKKNKGVK